MKIPKAIEILKEDLTSFDKDECPDWQDAIQLGIEALNQVQSMRRSFPKVAIRLLLGETED